MGQDIGSHLDPSEISVPIRTSSFKQCVKSSARVVDVLEYLHHLGHPARAIEVRRALGLAPSSASDLLKTLVDVGYLDFDETDKTYFPGLRVALFGQWVAKSYPQLRTLSELMEGLRAETGESVVLFVQRFHQVQVLALNQGVTPAPLHIVEGASLPVFGTAAGGAVLMVKSYAELCQIARRTFRTRSCGKAVEAMNQLVQNFKRQGYASSWRDDVIPNNWAIALPLPIKMRSGTIVMGVGGPIERVRMNERDLAELARDRILHFIH